VRIVNKNGRREHAIALLGAGLVVGAVGLIGGPRVTPPVLRSLGCMWPEGPMWAHLFFAATLVSSLITLAGIFGRWSGVKSLLIEAGGWWLQAAAWLGYGLAVFAKLGADGVIFALVVVCFSVAHIVRAVRIPGEAKRLATAVVVAGLDVEQS
jgi:hypothetical protein